MNCLKNNNKKQEKDSQLNTMSGQTVNTTKTPQMNSCHTNLSFMEEKDDERLESNEDNANALREILKQTLPDERVSKECQDSDNKSLDDGYTSEGIMSITNSDSFELFMPETFIDMVPVPNVILSSRRNSHVSGIGQFISNSRGPSRTASKKFQRSASQKRRTSTDIDERQYGNSRRDSRFTHQDYDGSRRPSDIHHQWDGHRVISRQDSRKGWESSNISQLSSLNDDTTVRQPAKVRLSLTPEMISDQYVINCIEDAEEQRISAQEFKQERAWIKLLKNPDFYRVSSKQINKFGLFCSWMVTGYDSPKSDFLSL